METKDNRNYKFDQVIKTDFGLTKKTLMIKYGMSQPEDAHDDKRGYVYKFFLDFDAGNKKSKKNVFVAFKIFQFKTDNDDETELSKFSKNDSIKEFIEKKFFSISQKNPKFKFQDFLSFFRVEVSEATLNEIPDETVEFEMIYEEFLITVCSPNFDKFMEAVNDYYFFKSMEAEFDKQSNFLNNFFF